ncbi:hypothetical protein EV701_14624 [Chthoniobacter flavus]|uniref:hypothetical protein n=1 Tax=Chthoniobacter flavus TaxID=191863 RepID=UPI00104402BF|nr:hypothetical protein [Chthoniobacter flavus]TCO82535.1 hypothetical protein EV701_14624 [Chthoniobacter flavus]
MPRPILKQFGDLKPEDFRQHPIWVSVHTLDYGAEWYEETDEETFRPWLEKPPVGADEMFLVSARLTFADGTEFDGFVTPARSYEGLRSMGSLQPQIFAPSGRRFGFWQGMFRRSESERDFYQTFTKSPQQVFPIRFQPLPGLTSSVASGEIPGFMSRPRGEVEVTQ